MMMWRKRLNLRGMQLGGMQLGGVQLKGVQLRGMNRVSLPLAKAGGLVAALVMLSVAPIGLAGPAQALRSAQPELSQLRPDLPSNTAADTWMVKLPGDAREVLPKVEASGLKLERWLAEQLYLVRGTKSSVEKLSQQYALREGESRWSFQGRWRLAPELLRLQGNEGTVRLVLHFFSELTETQVRRELSALGLKPVQVVPGQTRKAGEVIPLHTPRVALQVDARELVQLLPRLTGWSSLFFAELRGVVKLSNLEAVPIVQNGSADAALALADAGLLGQGQVVGYIDTGLDIDSCFFRDSTGASVATNVGGATAIDPRHRKVMAYDFLWSKDSPSSATAYDSHGHGTHVGGNIGGDNLLTVGVHDEDDGVAPLAKLVVQDGGYTTDNCGDLPGLGCPVVDLKPIFAQAYAQGARIHTNSWGDNENSTSQNNYSVGSQDVDTFMWENRDFLLLFAAGNSGPGSATVGSPSTAKNALSIGGTVNGAGLNSISSFSSRGPTVDNRLKPDLMAPANNTSADSDFNIGTQNCGLDSGAGTSYASPLAAGAAALVRQYYMDGYYPTGAPDPARALKPSAALVRATLLNSGENMTGARSYPGMDQGWGRIQLNSALPLPGDKEKLSVIDEGSGFLSSADAVRVYTFTVRDTSQPLKVTLSWTDAPSTPAAATNLVNDLDLVVEGPRRTYLGNVFRRGESTTGGSADSVNNHEQVLVQAPQAGTWTVKIKPSRIVQGPQPFALVVRGGF